MQLFLFIVMLSIGGFLFAGTFRNSGWVLADQVCTVGAIFCDNPVMLLVVGGILLLAVTVRVVI